MIKLQIIGEIKKMTEAQVLAYVLEHRKVTAPRIAGHFRETLSSVHQALLRLERKGLIGRKKLSYNVEFFLTEKAKNLSRQMKDNYSFLPFIIFLGLASLILVLTSNTNKDGEDGTNKD